MSARLKLLLITIFSLFATAATGIYVTQRQPSAALLNNTSNGQPQYLSASQTENVVGQPERAKYKPIPLDSVNSPLQGSDPAELAINAFDRDMKLYTGPRKVEVYYPQPNQAFVTITQMKAVRDYTTAVKYRVELTTFGRSLLVSSPRVWQIVWAGFQKECLPESRAQNNRYQTKPVCQSLELRVRS
ncbi:MAG: hypothetical protein SAK29_19510 [Scytonema sp. PMC 1069.18]|nr:hypothetical protein [Scytonema sp. PMC 1069.18]MEC4880747.1 hypothetical protein [Scytonema sp. PMC 1070.18]